MTILTTGGMFCKSIKEPLDGAPFVTGCLTLLRQFHCNHTEECLTLLGQYIRSMVDAQHTGKWVMSSCDVTDNVIIGRSQLIYPVTLLMFCFSLRSSYITATCLGRWGSHPLVITATPTCDHHDFNTAKNTCFLEKYSFWGVLGY